MECEGLRHVTGLKEALGKCGLLCFRRGVVHMLCMLRAGECGGLGAFFWPVVQDLGA